MNIVDVEILEKQQFEQLIQGLIDDQYGCCNDFLTVDIINELRNIMTNLISEGTMKAAGIGHNLDFREDKLTRSDKVNWIEDHSINSLERLYLDKIWRFINHLNSTCFTSIKTFESHYASYEIGNFYKRHLDQFKNEKGRKFSIVLYLNQDWKEEDGGRLSMYPINSDPVNILPIGGRMVFFRSDQMEHEVHPSTTRERRSIAGWLKN